MALLEAMAAAVPVLSTTVGGIPDILDHGQAGVLVSPGDVPALAAAMLELIQDRDLRDTLALRGRLRVEAAFSRTVTKRSMPLFSGSGREGGDDQDSGVDVP